MCLKSTFAFSDFTKPMTMNKARFERQRSSQGCSSQAETGIVCREIGISSDWEEEIPAGYVHVKLFVIEGMLETLVDGKSYALHRGDWLDTVNRTVCLRQVSSDARAFLLLLSDEVMNRILREKRPFPPAYLMRMLQNPVIRIPLIYYSTVIRGMEHIRQATLAGSSRFSQDILQSKVLIFFLEVADFLVDEADFGSLSDAGKHSQIFINFLQLLRVHIRSEHTAHFYAGQLNITPQYLRRIVKQQSGCSLYQFICRNLNREVCKLLLETGLTLQEIADELHFSDQAVLSKFFKRYNGIPPLKYRNEHR